jgi:lysophospholipase L1-like esterase
MRLLSITLLVAGSTLALAQTGVPKPGLPTVFVAGDSTASNGDRLGWGDPFENYFDSSKVNVLNRARAGRSARTFLNEGLWEKLLAEVKSGDYVLIQFGHNDGGAPDQPPARGDLPGIGDEARQFTMPDGSSELVHTFGWYIRKFVTDAQTKGAHPIVLSPTVRNIWQAGSVERGTGSGRFGGWSQQVADAEKVPFVDATNIIADVYESMGAERIMPLFPLDHTHTSQAGADLNASLIVAGLKGIRSPLAQFLSAKGQAVTAAPDLARLHLPEPVNPALPTLFLIGDSTVRNGGGDGAGGQWGWGEPLFNRFNPAKVNVVNRAVGGLSSRTFYTGVYWRRVLDMIKLGDFVVMQFGHNDGGAVDGPQGARVSLPGIGDETTQVTQAGEGKPETVHTFGWYLKQFVAETRAKGATPIVCSLIPRKIWKDGKIARNSQDYGKWAAEVARSEKAPFIDLNELIAREYDRLGAANVEPLFADEHTHTTRQGAELNATIVATAIGSLGDLQLAQSLVDRK